MDETHFKSWPHFHVDSAQGERLVDQNHRSYASVATPW